MTDQIATIGAPEPKCRFSLPSRMVEKIDMTDIAAVRADLAAWSAGKPKAVQNAVANLDGWLDLADSRETLGVNVLACTARAVETLRRATGSA